MFSVAVDQALSLSADDAASRLLALPEDQWFERKSGAVRPQGPCRPPGCYGSCRIEITSPGRFPGLADPADPESISRHARNPRIARVCADLGITQELGEGIRRIFAEMRRVGLSEPVYQQAPEAVRLTLLASSTVPESVAHQVGPSVMRILDALRLAQRPLGTGQVVELVGMARPTVLRHLAALRDAGLVVWEGESPRDPRATWRVV